MPQTRFSKISALVVAFGCLSASSNAALITADITYYVDEAPNTVVSSVFSTSGTFLQTSGSFTAPSGTSTWGLAGFDDGRFFGASSLIRSIALGFSEVSTAATGFRDELSIDTGGACPPETPCSLKFSYTATGSFSVTGSPAFAGQLDFAVLNPETPGDRSTWLVDHPVFVSPGLVTVTDIGSISFVDNEAFTFWPVFGVVARQISGSGGTSSLDFSHSLIFNGFSVIAEGERDVDFLVKADSGLIYSRAGLSAPPSTVPEPSTTPLVVAALGLMLTVFRRADKTVFSPIRKPG